MKLRDLVAYAARTRCGRQRRGLAFCQLATAIFLFAGGEARAATVCVHDTIGLAVALSNASTGGPLNAEANTILIAAGTYSAASETFTFHSLSGYALDVEGGYDYASNNCTIQNPAPGRSVLDGGSAKQVLALQSNGNITLRHVTIQNGRHLGSSGGGVQVVLTQVQASDPIPVAVFADNVVQANTSDFSVGGLDVYTFDVSHAAAVHVDNSLFVNNSAPTACALRLDIGTGSTAYLTNDTITGNSCSTLGASATVVGASTGTVAGYVSNTIGYANTATHDFLLNVDNSVQLTNNDYGSINGMPTIGSSGNLVGVDPQFFSGGDYHLKPASALNNAGTLAPAGGLSATDIEGRPRTFAGHVDLGAYEHGDGIFVNGFDPS